MIHSQKVIVGCEHIHPGHTYLGEFNEDGLPDCAGGQDARDPLLQETSRASAHHHE